MVRITEQKVRSSSWRSLIETIILTAWKPCNLLNFSESQFPDDITSLTGFLLGFKCEIALE